MTAGHSNQWKVTAMALGFAVRPAAAGQVYHLAMIDPQVRRAVYELAQRIGDGRPEFRTFAVSTLPTKAPTVLGRRWHQGRPLTR
jgi:hypothetical protein